MKGVTSRELFCHQTRIPTMLCTGKFVFRFFQVLGAGGPIHPLPHYDVGTNPDSYQPE